MAAKVEATSTGIVRTERRLGERRNWGGRLSAPAVPMSLAVALSPRQCVSGLAPSSGVPHVPLFEGQARGAADMSVWPTGTISLSMRMDPSKVALCMAPSPRALSSSRRVSARASLPGHSCTAAQLMRSCSWVSINPVKTHMPNPIATTEKDKKWKKLRLGKKRIGVRRLICARHTSRGPRGEARRPALGDRSQGRSPGWF